MMDTVKYTYANVYRQVSRFFRRIIRRILLRSDADDGAIPPHPLSMLYFFANNAQGWTTSEIRAALRKLDEPQTQDAWIAWTESYDFSSDSVEALLYQQPRKPHDKPICRIKMFRSDYLKNQLFIARQLRLVADAITLFQGKENTNG